MIILVLSSRTAIPSVGSFMYLNYMCMLFLHCSLNSIVNQLSSAMQFYIPTLGNELKKNLL